MSLEEILMMNKQLVAAIMLVVWSVTGSSQNLEGAAGEKVKTTLATWESINKTYLAGGTQEKLLADVATARDEVKKRNPNVSSEKLDLATPRAVATYLDRSAENKRTPSLGSLMEQSIFGNGAVLEAFSDYPTLVVKVTPDNPPDFVVTIDGTAFAPGACKFRIPVGEVHVRVARNEHKACTKSIQVTATGPNVFSCEL